MTPSFLRSLRLILVGAVLATLGVSTPAQAETYVPINGAGSSWSANAIDQWRRNVEQYGMRVNYASNGSSDGRNQFKAGTVDFASSEIPFGLKDGQVIDTLPSRDFAYMPIVAGGTALMYNLTIGGKRVTNLRLSGEVITKIFTGVIAKWNDPAIAADNPGITLPARAVIPVVRSDGSGSTAQFTTWMADTQTGLWDAYCKQAGRAIPCGVTSNYPTISGKGFVAQPNSQGVAGYVAQKANEGTITYVEYSYALKTGYPVAKVLNTAGYYVEPTASNVAVGLLAAKINTDKKSPQYLTQNLEGVYASSDKRTYPLSSYSYLIVPTGTQNGFTTAKGKTLAAFSYYFLCEGQQQAEVLGYSPLPINLVKAGLEQVKQIPGVASQNVDLKSCNNPTFSADGTNTLAKNAPQPSECDKRGVDQCSNGTGGAKDQDTKVKPKPNSTKPGQPNTGKPTTGGPGSNGDPGTTNPDGTDPTTGTDGAGSDGGAGDGDANSGAPGTGDGSAGGGYGGNGSVAANYGGGPVLCESDTGVCTNVVALPTETVSRSGSSSGWLTAGLAAAVLAGLILIPPLASRALPVTSSRKKAKK